MALLDNKMSQSYTLLYYEQVRLFDTFAHMYTSAQQFCKQKIINNIIINHYDNLKRTLISVVNFKVKYHFAVTSTFSALICH